MTAKTNEKKSLITQLREFFPLAITELKKVTWPTTQETIQATIVTIIIMVIVSLSLFVMDYVFGNLMASILS